jgi:hypothetical protein
MLPRRRAKTVSWLVLVLAGLGAVGVALAQRGFLGGGQILVDPSTRTAREVRSRSTGTPEWENPAGFRSDVFTFARLRYDAAPRPPTGLGGWTTDLPDADLNLSYRLQQLTSLRVDPDCRLVRATDPDLSRYPFLFAAAPGAMALTPAEIVALRNYLLNGGFMLMTDYWGDDDAANVERLFAEILPGYRFEELPIEHPLYRIVLPIRQKVAVENIRLGLKVRPSEVHHRVILDPQGRIMVMGLHNSDDSDGWEREGENHEYFQKFSEKYAYPLAISIIVYTMTH